MVIFLDEERAYLSWIGHHREGFVIEAQRRPTRKRPVLHRAACDEIRSSGSRHSHWTTGRRLKACGLDRSELIAWSEREYTHSLVECTLCRPCAEQPVTLLARAGDARPLTRLGREIVDFVVESAVIQLDRGGAEYNLTLGELAAALHKSPGQLTSTMLRLIEDGYLRVEGKPALGKPFPTNCSVYPTQAALRTLPFFAEQSKRAIDKELKRLSAGNR
jgi:hypothetical protein